MSDRSNDYKIHLFIYPEYTLITQFNNENDNIIDVICKRCKSTTTVTV